MAMKKYKIALGICGSHVLYSKPTRAFDERNAVVKYLLSEGKDPTEEEIGKLLGRVVEHVPKPRKRRGAEERDSE
jgi:hypothetical protein